MHVWRACYKGMFRRTTRWQFNFVLFVHFNWLDRFVTLQSVGINSLSNNWDVNMNSLEEKTPSWKRTLDSVFFTFFAEYGYYTCSTMLFIDSSVALNSWSLLYVKRCGLPFHIFDWYILFPLCKEEWDVELKNRRWF